ncbi:MAG: hypothetical protein ACFFBP_06545 [Promethearchaeota archaeon]
MDFNEMPKICIKCKKSEESGVEILKYDYYKSKVRGGFSSTTTTRTVGISFPVCDTCGLQFKKYQKYESFYESSRRFLIIGSFIMWALVFGVIYYFLTSARYNYGFDPIYIFFIIFIILGILLPIIYIILHRIVFNDPNRISQYIKLTQDGDLSIEDEQIKEEIIKKVERDIYEYEHDINVVFCPKCGIKYKKGIDFCRQCGKDLRLIQKKL